MKVYVTGIGIVSAIGNNVEENEQSLLNIESGIQKDVQTDYHVAKVSSSCTELASEASVSRDKSLSRTSLLGLKAVKEAWGDSTQMDNIRTGFISATTVGGMDKSETMYQNKLSQKEFNFNHVLTHENGDTTEQIAKEMNFSGYINTLSTACSSSANSIMLGARLIEHGKLDRVVVGGTDSLTNFTLSGFSSLMIYSKDIVKPFDEMRSGLNLGEGAAYLVLENDKSLSFTNRKRLAELVGWSNASDAFHQTASSEDGKGASLAMQNAIIKAGISPSDISYVNTHGTGTMNNDLTESIALAQVFKKNIPPFSSTKAYTGHTLAASGAIESVFSILTMQKNFLPPNLFCENPIKEAITSIISGLRTDCDVDYVLTNSFGFGGNNTSLIFKKM